MKKISKDALNLFLNYSYVPEPLSIYENIFKLDAGEIVEIDLENLNFLSEQSFQKIKKKNGTKLNNKISDTNLTNLDFKKKLNHFDEILNESVKDTLTSDVEVGTFYQVE